MPSGKIEAESMQGRADVGDMPTADTLGTLARKMSQIPDVNRELAEVGAMFSVFDAIRRTRER